MSVTELTLRSVNEGFNALKLTLCVTKLDDDNQQDSYDCYITDFYQLDVEGTLKAEARSIECQLVASNTPCKGKAPHSWSLQKPYACEYGGDDDDDGQDASYLELRLLTWYPARGPEHDDLATSLVKYKGQDIVFATPNWK